jgi:hypothetical protein
MEHKIFGPRKQRTRAHVIADQSINYVERFVLDEGHIAQRLDSDYGYDMVVFTFDEKGYFEPGSVYLQLKAAETLQTVGSDYVFDLDIRDYDLWHLENRPVILILFDASRRRAYWLAVQRYFWEDATRQPKKGAKTVRVRVPKRQVVTRRAVADWRDLKEQVHRWVIGGQT